MAKGRDTRRRFTSTQEFELQLVRHQHVRRVINFVGAFLIATGIRPMVEAIAGQSTSLTIYVPIAATLSALALALPIALNRRRAGR
ncbi:hypothetical protein [Aeromicrobium sp. Sec7.5]|uniref:hypothetical protein n=1 Tax=Aeromicrobium sp. Sec7.5 TaxID=3121276 RepID=UPI002FE4C071